MTGFPAALRVAWRRSRTFYIVWVLALIGLMPLTVTKYDELVPPGTNSDAMMALLGANPTMRALLGPAFDLSTPGGFTFWRVGTFTAAAVAMMAALGVIRATRAEEEEGRDELIRAGVVARHAPLAAGVALSMAACFSIGVLTTAFMVGVGTPVAGSVASGLGLALTGAMWAGVAAVTAQVFESARTARYWAVGIALGGLYLVRAIIDGSGEGSAIEPARWFVPLEWAALVRPYAHERWWVFVLPIVLTVALVALAFVLEALRDHGAGLVAPSLGPAVASRTLSEPWGLSWRLNRGSVIGWTIGLVVSAVGLGTLAGSMETIISGQAQVAEMLQKLGGSADSLKDGFYQAILSIMATIVSVFAITLLGRLRSEETRGHAEVMLSTKASRWTYSASFLVPAALFSSVLLVGLGAVMPLVDAMGGHADQIGALTAGALVFVPGVLLVVGLGMVLIGWAPNAFGLIWVVVGWTIFASWIGPLFNLPDWVLRLTPWGHLPHLPADPLTWTAILIESGVAIVAIALGMVGYRRRNIPA